MGRRTAFLSAVTLSLGLLLAAGEVKADAQHVAAEGLFLRTTTGGLIVRVVGADVTGALAQPNGTTSDVMNVTFLDENGIEFIPPDPATLQWTVANPALATVIQTGPWQIRVQGTAVGATTLEIRIFFINHVDYTSPPIPLRVLGTSDVPPSVSTSPIELRVAPNPIVSTAQVELRMPAAGSVRLELFDVNGRAHWSITRDGLPAGEQRWALPVDNLTPGVYWLRASGAGWNETRSFLRIR